MRSGLFAFSVMACLVASAAMAQDPVKVDPDPKHYKVEYEDDQVRVLRIHLDPKETSPMHNHPPTISPIQMAKRRNARRRLAQCATAQL